MKEWRGPFPQAVKNHEEGMRLNFTSLVRSCPVLDSPPPVFGSYLAAAGFILSGIFAILSIVLFFRLDIRNTSKDLSGKLAQEQIAALRGRADLDANKRAAAKVFQDLEAGSKRLRSMSQDTERESMDLGTSILQQGEVFAGFVGFRSEKRLVFIGTREIIS